MFQRLFDHKDNRKKAFYDRHVHENILVVPHSKLGKYIHFLVEICVIVGVLVLIIETIGNWGTRYFTYFFAVDLFVSLVFASEYVLRFIRAPHKLDFLKSFMNLIDFLSFAPFFIALLISKFTGLEALRILRLLRVLRLFEISAHSPIALGFIRTVKLYGREYKGIIGIFTSFLIIFSTFVYTFEYQVNSDFSSIPAALWWGVVTMTTVGYGDVTPITLGGKIFGAVLVFLGPILLAVISSITILVFMDVAEVHKHEQFKYCRSCEEKNPTPALYCMFCGKKKFKKADPDQRRRTKVKFLEGMFGKT